MTTRGRGSGVADGMVGRGVAAGLLSAMLMVPAAVFADAVLDGRTGSTGSFAGDFEIPAAVGRQEGGNLFHSFERFSVLQGESATFTGPAGIDNVISRVTGGEVSTINGELASTVPGADFFFLNPAGVVFGPEASLDIDGSFHVSTADELRFADGTRFSASDPDASSFTVAAPEAFGFLGAEPAGLLVDRGQLVVPPGEKLSLVGGDIILTAGNQGAASGGFAGRLVAPAGTIEVVAQNAPGEVVPGAGGASGGIILLANQATIDAGGPGGGNVRISGGEVVIAGQALVFADNTGGRDAAAERGVAIEAGTLTVTSGSIVTADALGEGNAGAVTIDAMGLVEVREDSQINSTTFAQGNAGKVTVTAEQVLVDGDDSGINSQATRGSSGNAGAVKIDATGLVEVREGGQISSSTFAQGDAGKVTVTAERVLVDGAGDPVVPRGRATSGINSQANRDSSGNAGAVTIDAAGLVEVRARGQISSTTFGQGDAGKVTIAAERVLVDGDGDLASIGSQVEPNSSGDAGAVTIDATGLVEVREGGQISSNTFAEGDAGEVTVEAGRVLVDAQDFGPGGSPDVSTLIGASAGDPDREPRGESLGNAGRVTINATERVDVRNGGLIDSLSLGRDAGEVTVTAPVVLIDGAGSTFFTGINTEVRQGSVGNAGRVTINAAKRVDVRNGGAITSSSFGRDAGEVTVTAPVVLIDGAGSTSRTVITSEVQTGSIGNAGTVTVKAWEELEIRNTGANRNRGESSISSSTFAEGDAGDVVVDAGRLVINGVPEAFTGIASQANEDSSGNAGKVTVIAETMEVHNGGDVASSSFAGGRAGDVVVRVPQLVVRDDGVITSSGLATGPAGNVRIESDSLLVASAGIRTVGTGATGGEILVEADDLIHLVDAEVTSNGIEPGARASLITLTAPQIALNDSRVTSLFGAGEPRRGSGEARLLGDLTVISPGSEVAASSVLEVTGLESDLTAGIEVLPAAFLDASALLRESCAARGSDQTSSFVSGGTQGLVTDPAAPLAGTYAAGEAREASFQHWTLAKASACDD